MFVRHLSLANFRNYTRLELDLPARVNVLQGENAQGKTNLLEAIYYLATTKSPLASTDRQLIAWAANAEVIPYARLQCVFSRGGEEHSIEMTLVVERQPNGDPAAAIFRRQIRLDGANRRALDVVGRLNVVLFLPEDIALVAGSPEERRRYLDISLCQIDPAYCMSLSRYNRVITQRNALLRQIRDREASPAHLEYWDEQLVRHGSYVLARRLWATAELDRQVAAIHTALTGGAEHLTLTYQGTISRSLDNQGQAFPGASGPLEESRPGQEAHLVETFRRALQTVRREETARAVTVVGPHRDDLSFLANGIDMTVYGSRGQQRTVALALKLAEVALMREQTQEMPILLLDDVVSELDQHRSEFLLEHVTHAEQVLITTTDLKHYRREFLASTALWQVIAGMVRPLEGPLSEASAPQPG